MGGFWSKDDLSADFVQELMDETGFNQKQIHRLYIRFRHLDKDKKGYLTKEDLLRLPQVNTIIFYKIAPRCNASLFQQRMLDVLQAIYMRLSSESRMPSFKFLWVEIQQLLSLSM